MAAWRQVKNSASILVVVFLVLYMTYCTQELYHRVQSSRKLERLKEYEKEVDELTSMLKEYKRDAGTVQRSLKLLREAFNQITVTQKTSSGSNR